MHLNAPTVIQSRWGNGDVGHLRRVVAGRDTTIIHCVGIAPVKDTPWPGGGPGIGSGVAQIEYHPIQADATVATNRIQELIKDQRADLGGSAQIDSNA